MNRFNSVVALLCLMITSYGQVKELTIEPMDVHVVHDRVVVTYFNFIELKQDSVIDWSSLPFPSGNPFCMDRSGYPTVNVREVVHEIDSFYIVRWVLDDDSSVLVQKVRFRKDMEATGRAVNYFAGDSTSCFFAHGVKSGMEVMRVSDRRVIRNYRNGQLDGPKFFYDERGLYLLSFYSKGVYEYTFDVDMVNGIPCLREKRGRDITLDGSRRDGWFRTYRCDGTLEKMVLYRAGRRVEVRYFDHSGMFLTSEQL